jgi:hypothetical protein
MSSKSRKHRPKGVAVAIHNATAERLRATEEQLRQAHTFLVHLVRDQGGEVRIAPGELQGPWSLEAESGEGGSVILRLKSDAGTKHEQAPTAG